MIENLTLLLGGARSGKSSYAEKLAAQTGARVLYVATAQAWDEEMQARIVAHQQSRPANWRTVEAPGQVGPAVQAALADGPADVVLLDCITMLISNRILAGTSEETEKIDQKAARDRVTAELDSLLAAVQASGLPWIVVSNEVGMGLVPPYPLGRVYRDLLGWANQRLAAAAGRVLLLVAGLPLDIKALSKSQFPDQ